MDRVTTGNILQISAGTRTILYAARTDWQAKGDSFN